MIASVQIRLVDCKDVLFEPKEGNFLVHLKNSNNKGGEEGVKLSTLIFSLVGRVRRTICALIF